MLPTLKILALKIHTIAEACGLDASLKAICKPNVFFGTPVVLSAYNATSVELDIQVAEQM